MMKLAATSTKAPVKFRIPTADNLVPIRLDIEIDGLRFRDAFTWNPTDPDSEIVVFAKRTVKDLKLPPAFITQIAQSIQVLFACQLPRFKMTMAKSEVNSEPILATEDIHIVTVYGRIYFLQVDKSQLTEFRSFEGHDMYAGEKIVPIKLDLRVNHTVIRDQFLWDLNNFESDPEEFARTFCRDLGIEDPEVGPAIAVAIREQLYEIATQSVASVRETRINKKGRRGTEFFPASKAGIPTVDLMKLFSSRSSAVRKRREWDVYEPIVDLLSNEEVEALEAKEERIAR